MELPVRAKGDRYLRPGEYSSVVRALRRDSYGAATSALVYGAFDHRTQIGAHAVFHKLMLQGGPIAIGSALADAGFTRTRVLLRQLTPNVLPSNVRMDDAPPQMLFVSSMQIHMASAVEVISDAYRLGDERPFILAGGPKAMYEPWDYFGIDPTGRISADVVVTGEAFVAMQLLQRMAECRTRGEHPRRTFHRLRLSGLLDDIPGLVFREGPEKAPLERLICTGTQRLIPDLDEMPSVLLGLSVMEKPHHRTHLSKQPLPLDRFRKYPFILPLVISFGCKFRCPYCAIPAYNQFGIRQKSPERLRDEIKEVVEKTGIGRFMGADDNLFNSRGKVAGIFDVLARAKANGKPFRDQVDISTEATEHDVFNNRDLLPLCRAGGLRMLAFGIEDMSAELVKKGQNADKTRKLFEVLIKADIRPFAMMVHHDGQPLSTRKSLYGLLNQVGFLYREGAIDLQVTYLGPAARTKIEEDAYNSGTVFERVGGVPIEEFRKDGNHVVATREPCPWKRQANLLVAYAMFYNPLNLIRALFRKDAVWGRRIISQVSGMCCVAYSTVKWLRWVLALYRGPIERWSGMPPHRVMVAPDPAGVLAAVGQVNNHCTPSKPLVGDGSVDLETDDVAEPITAGVGRHREMRGSRTVAGVGH